jgi:rhodanese-related sulfurtransferase
MKPARHLWVSVPLVIQAGFAGLIGAFLLNAATAPAAHRVGPRELQKQLTDNRQFTLIDVRNAVDYQAGHIPGAINIPAALVAEAKLPRLGRAIVYDDGLGPATSDTAAAALNQKPGIEAQALRGGFAAWESYGGATTRTTGLSRESIRLITYEQLKRSDFSDLVLVDLRPPRAQARPAAAEPQATPSRPPLTDLQQAFPNARVTRSPLDSQLTRQGLDPQAVPPLLVLIDDNDGAAQATARALRANGLHRVVILAGGEAILSRGGKPGLQRIGSTTPDPPPH